MKTLLLLVSVLGIAVAERFYAWYWDDDLGYMAQKAARQCKYDVYKEDQRNNVKIYGLFRPDYNTWRVPGDQFFIDPVEAVYAWHNESLIFKWCRFTTGVRNYTNMVSSYVTRLGCGIGQCGSDVNIWCLYGSKTTGDSNMPYLTSMSSEQGGYCANKTAEGLCDCGGKFCYNDGEIQPDCSCKCGEYARPHNDDPSRNCKMECPVADDVSSKWICQQQDCTSDYIQTYQCPVTCNSCTWYQDMWDMTDEAYNKSYIL